MKIRWYGHACFEIEFDSGMKVLTDPFKPNCFNNSLRYNANFEKPDIITISHNHDDHNYRPFNDIEYVDNAKEYDFDNLKIIGIKTFHDKSSGNERGKNIVFEFIENGKKIVHLGDLGHIPLNDVLEKIKFPYIVFIPVGGTFTIDAKEAKTLIDIIKPEIIIPMHYKTSYIDFPIKDVSNFLSFFDNENIVKINSDNCIIKSEYKDKILIFST